MSSVYSLRLFLSSLYDIIIAMENKLILVTNPGSSSRKYALYHITKSKDEFVCGLHFEFEDGKIICTFENADGSKEPLDLVLHSLSGSVVAVRQILTERGIISDSQPIDAILARVVATGDFFTEDHIVNDEVLGQLERAKKRTPLHVPVVVDEIEAFVEEFKEAKVLTISDTAFHTSRPKLHKYYAIDVELADDNEIKRYGAHGLSISSVVETMTREKILPERAIVCHLGSGASLTAVKDGKSFDTTMGYSPLEGIMMSTRSGSMDPAAAFAVGRALKMDDPQDLEEYLNKQSGLKGVSGETDDMRQIIELAAGENERGKLAFDMFVYRVQTALGQMAAAMNGTDAIVFTATIGERSAPVRKAVCEKIGYLGFEMDADKNEAATGSNGPENIAAEGSKPIWVLHTDESAEILHRAKLLLATVED